MVEELGRKRGDHVGGVEGKENCGVRGHFIIISQVRRSTLANPY